MVFWVAGVHVSVLDDCVLEQRLVELQSKDKLVALHLKLALISLKAAFVVSRDQIYGPRVVVVGKFLWFYDSSDTGLTGSPFKVLNQIFWSVSGGSRFASVRRYFCTKNLSKIGRFVRAQFCQDKIRRILLFKTETVSPDC